MLEVYCCYLNIGVYKGKKSELDDKRNVSNARKIWSY